MIDLEIQNAELVEQINSLQAAYGRMVDEHFEEKKELKAQLAKANERVKELELVVVAITHADETGYVDDVGFVKGWSDVCDETKALLNKFAIEKQIQALNWCLSRCNHSFDSWADVGMYDSGISNSEIEARIKQLRKEQE